MKTKFTKLGIGHEYLGHFRGEKILRAGHNKNPWPEDAGTQKRDEMRPLKDASDATLHELRRLENQPSKRPLSSEEADKELIRRINDLVR